MDKTKSRLAELLGVEVGEVFSFEYRMALKPNEYFINDCGIICFAKSKNPVDVLIVYDLIERPDAIIRKPRFSDEEMTVLRALWNADVQSIKRLDDADVRFWYRNSRPGWWYVNIIADILRPGESVDLEAMFGKEVGDA